MHVSRSVQSGKAASDKSVLKLRLLIGVATAFLFAGSALAQVMNPQVVVTAPEPFDAPAAKRLAHEIADNGDDLLQPLARFNDPVCPAVHGVSDAVAVRMVLRIREVARRAGIAVGRKRCVTNLSVEFVESGQAVVSDLQRKNSPALSSLPLTQVSALVRDQGAVHAWSVVEVRSRDGNYLGYPILQRANNKSTDAPLLQVQTSSIIVSTFRRDIVRSIVLLDISATLGKSVLQLADYAAMRGLAQTRPPTVGQGTATILRLFGGAQAPATLTGFDSAYLRSLYRGEATQPALTKRLILSTKK